MRAAELRIALLQAQSAIRKSRSQIVTTPTDPPTSHSAASAPVTARLSVYEGSDELPVPVEDVPAAVPWSVTPVLPGAALRGTRRSTLAMSDALSGGSVGGAETQRVRPPSVLQPEPAEPTGLPPTRGTPTLFAPF